MYKAFTFSFTYLILLFVLKYKMLWKYQHLFSRIYDKTAQWIPFKYGWVHPAFYLDDILVAFSIYLIFYFSYQRESRTLTILNYIAYFIICAFSIFSAFIFYKYETPINLDVLYQIDSLFTMKTSIDLEIAENARLFFYFIALIFFSQIFPFFMRIIHKKLLSKILPVSISTKGNEKYLIAAFLVLGMLSAFKHYYYGLEILTDTPVTTFLKSTVKKFKLNQFIANHKIPEFNDQFDIADRNNVLQQRDILWKRRKNYNIILILLETTNYEIFSDTQNREKILPNISKLEEKSIILRNFYSPYPRSSKSFFASLTGHYPLTSYESIIKSYPYIKVPDIFSVMKSHGYKTYAGYSGNFHYDRMADFLKNRGVDKQVDVRNNDGSYKQISWCADDMLIYKELFSWISTINGSKRFFALLLPMNTHHPFWVPSPEHKILPEKTKTDRYKNALHYQDLLIGKLIKFLKNDNKLDNTVIIITGDHGTMFNLLKKDKKSLSPYLINKSSVHVPFLLYGPFTDEIRNDIDVMGSHIDILPTILDILNIRSPQKIEGRSLFGVNTNYRINYVYLDYYHQIVCGLTKDFKIMFDFDTGQRILSKTMLFQKDICLENSVICDQLTNKVVDFKNYQNKRIFTKINR